MIIFLNPDGDGRGRYERKPIRDPVLTGIFSVKAELKSGDDAHAALKLVRCPVEATLDSPRIVRDIEIVEEFESLPVNNLEWTLDSTKYPDGQYALTTDVWCMTLPIVVDNGNYRNDIPQYVGLAPMEGITGRNDADSGWCWVKWMGQREIREIKRPVKLATPIQGRPKPEDLVAQRLTYMYSGNDSPWEWRIGKSGNILTHYKHQYHSSDLDNLHTGLNRDGYINEGRISHPAGGFVHPDGSLVIASRSGRVVRIHLDGYVETIAGSRIPSHLPHPVRGSSDERLAEFYEIVGIDLAGGCHDVCGDPDDPDIIYIADSNNNRILKGNITTKQFTILIGGRGYDQQVSEPRGLDIGPDGILAVADYRNLSIAFCNKETGEILWRFDSIRPSGEHRPDDWDGTTKIPEHFQATTARIREVSRWGEAGNAAFMYPSMCRFDSQGDLIIAHDRQQQISRLRLSGTLTLELITDIEPDTSNNTYTVLSVDKTGAFGEIDDIFVCNWEHTSEAWLDKNGNKLGTIQNHSGRRSVLWDGYYPNSQYTRYPQTVVVGQDGSLWVGGVSGAGIYRYIKRTDEPVPDVKRLQLGLSHWNSNYHQDRPLLYLLAGVSGQDQWGGLTVDELAQQTDDEIADYIRNNLTRDDLTDVEIKELIYYLRYEAIKDAVSVYSPIEIPYKPEPLVSHQSLMDLAPGQSLDLGTYECESRVPGVSCKSIFAFSNLVYDPVNHRLLVFGGGHAATNRTDVDSFDLKTLIWTSLYPSMTCEQINNQDDVDPRGFYISTGHPLARHTYDQMIVAPINDVLHLMLFSNEGFSGRCKDFSQRPRSVAALPLVGSPVWKYSREFELPWGYSFPAELDFVSGKVVCLSAHRRMYFYDPMTEEVISSADLYPAKVSNSSTLTYFPPLDMMYLIDRGTMDVYEIQINHDDLSATTAEPVETTGDKPKSLRNIAYDTENQILGGVEDSAFYAFDPITNVWSRYPIPNSPGNVYAHAIAFDPVSKAFIFVTDRDSGQRVWAYKFDPDAKSILLPTEPEEPDVAETSLEVALVVDSQEGWGDEFPDGGRYSRKLSDVVVTDPSLVLVCVAVRDRAESVENELEPGVAAPIRYGNTHMHDVMSDPGNDGKSNRGAHCYRLQVADRTDSILWSLGRIGGLKANTSGRCAGIGCVIPGGFVRDVLPVKIESGESISATIPTEPGDLVLSFLSSGTNSYTDYPTPNGTVIGQNYMNPSVPVRGQLAVHADGNVKWTGVEGDGEQSMALIVLAISSTEPVEEDPPIEEPSVDDHPAKVMLADAKSALIDAKTNIDAAIASIDLIDTEL